MRCAQNNGLAAMLRTVLLQRAIGIGSLWVLSLSNAARCTRTYADNSEKQDTDNCKANEYKD